MDDDNHGDSPTAASLPPSGTRRRLLCAAGAVALGAGVGPARAQATPGLIKMIVVVPPGATMDIIARAVADKLKDLLQVPVIVDYKSGGTGLAAAQYLKSTDPDGSTILFTPTSAASFFPFLYSSLPFDPDKDLAPVTHGVSIPTALAVSLGTGATTLSQYLDKARGDKMLASVGTSSLSSIGSFLILRLAKLSGADLQLVPYKGGQPLIGDLLGNQIPAGNSVLSDYLKLHQDGRLRILATSGAKRSPLAPDLPTFAESGFPDLHGESSIGFFVRGGTSESLIDRYAVAINSVLEMPDVRKRFGELGVEAAPSNPQSYKALIQSDRARWEPVARAANIRIN